MADKKITLKRNNAGTIDRLFPTTTTDQIMFYDPNFSQTGESYVPVFDSNGKIKAKHIPSSFMGGLQFAGALNLTASGGSNDTINQLLIAYYNNANYLGTLAPGYFWIVQTAGVVSGFSAGGSGGASYWVVSGEEGEYEDVPSDAVGEDITLEVGDYIVYTGSESLSQNSVTVYKHYFSVINNDERIATTERPGLISAANQTKLDGIAASADNYGGFVVSDSESTPNTETIVSGGTVTFAGAGGASVLNSSGTITITAPAAYSHPSHTARSIDTSGVDVLDTFTSDTLGHITAITKRTLPNATVNAAGVMSGADKKKLDETNVVRYANADSSASTFGYIYFDED